MPAAYFHEAVARKAFERIGGAPQPEAVWIPVSYTHLDVYKRQSPAWPRTCAGRRLRAERHFFKGAVLCRKGAASFCLSRSILCRP